MLPINQLAHYEHAYSRVLQNARCGYRPTVEVVHRHLPDAAWQSLEEEQAQEVVARHYGMTSWDALTAAVESMPEPTVDTDVVAMREAIEGGRLDEVLELVARRPELATTPDEQCVVPLHHACMPNSSTPFRVPHQVEIARALIDAGAGVNWRSEAAWGETPMHTALSVDNIDVAAALLDAGADLEGAGGIVDAGTSLANALYFGQEKAIDFLVERGAQIYNLPLAAGVGDSARVETFFRGDELLPEADYHPDRVAALPLDRDAILAKALAYAAGSGHDGVVGLLLDRGAKANQVVSRTPFDTAAAPLHHAAGGGWPTVVGTLLTRGAAVAVKDGEYGGTPLGWAIHAISEGWVPDDRGLGVVEQLVGAGSPVSEWALDTAGKAEVPCADELVRILRSAPE